MEQAKRHPAVYAVAAVVSVAIIFALAASFRRDGPAALEAWRSADIQVVWVVVGIVLGLIGHGLNVMGWKRLIEDCGVPIGWIATIRMFAVSSLGRYLPAGKGWQLGIVGAMAMEQGMPLGTLTATSLFHGAVGVVVGGLLLLAAGGAVLGVSPWLVSLPVTGLIALIALPVALRAIPMLHNALTNRVPQVSSVTSATMWVLVWSALASWICWGLGLYALGVAVFRDLGLTPVAAVVAWTGSFLGGLIAFVSPAGLGAREGIMQGLLTQSGLDAGSALLLTALARVGATVLDIAPALAVLAIRPKPAGIAIPTSDNSVT